MTGKRVALDTPKADAGAPRTGPVVVQYRIQFLDGVGNVVRELSASARNVAAAIELIVDADWPPQTVTMRVLDAYGREVHSATRRDVTKRELRLDGRDGRTVLPLVLRDDPRSPSYGHCGEACAARRAHRSRAIMNSSASLRPRPMRSWRLSMKRRCRSF